MRLPFGETCAERYPGEPSVNTRVALTRLGTRVLKDFAALAGMDHPPWTLRYTYGGCSTCRS